MARISAASRKNISAENFNSRLKELLSKDFDHRILFQKLLDCIVNIMNNIPKNSLNYKTLHEVLHDKLNKKFKEWVALQN